MEEKREKAFGLDTRQYLASSSAGEWEKGVGWSGTIIVMNE